MAPRLQHKIVEGQSRGEIEAEAASRGLLGQACITVHKFGQVDGEEALIRHDLRNLRAKIGKFSVHARFPEPPLAARLVFFEQAHSLTVSQ